MVEEIDAALLVVSELVTNAIAHTQGEVGMDLTLSADRLRIAVNDASPRSPVKPVWVSWESTGGRGLLIVEATTAAWGSVPLSGGKQVWAEILCHRTNGRMHGLRRSPVRHGTAHFGDGPLRRRPGSETARLGAAGCGDGAAAGVRGAVTAGHPPLPAAALSVVAATFGV